MHNLGREERLSRATEILNSKELKQAICHQILGTTFKDIERAMTGIINERQMTEEQEERLELEKLAPEKFTPEIAFKANKQASNNRKEIRYTTYTREQVAALMAASNAPILQEEEMPRREYETLSREECERLVREHFEYNERENKLKQERIKWDLQKTTELEAKTKSTTKRTKSTKD